MEADDDIHPTEAAPENHSHIDRAKKSIAEAMKNIVAINNIFILPVFGPEIHQHAGDVAITTEQECQAYISEQQQLCILKGENDMNALDKLNEPNRSQSESDPSDPPDQDRHSISSIGSTYQVSESSMTTTALKVNRIHRQTLGKLLDIQLAGCFDHNKWWAVEYRQPEIPELRQKNWTIRAWRKVHYTPEQRSERLFDAECEKSAETHRISETQASLIAFFNLNANDLRDKLKQLPVMELPRINNVATDMDAVIRRTVEKAERLVNAAVRNYCKRPFEEVNEKSKVLTAIERSHKDFEAKVQAIIAILAAEFKVVCDPFFHAHV